MCFSDARNQRQESRHAATGAARGAQSSSQDYGRRPQPTQQATGGYGYPQNFRVGVSYDQPRYSHQRPSNDPRAVWILEHRQQNSQPHPYVQPYTQQRPQNPPQQYPQYNNRGQGQQQFRPYRPDPLQETNVQNVPVSRPMVTPGYNQERHQSVHGDIGYQQPSRVGSTSAAYSNTSQRVATMPQRPAGLKPAGRPMNPELTLSKSRPGKLVRRDSNGVSECSDDDYAVDLRSYTVSPDIARGRPNRPRRPSKH
ncbi:uncharacterized protein GGS22DRAFT_149538 [Annulohypoxylon maeteangense]|uniref:uncharacterized protein n=1 Tax=Annulohypoxylon maeteangense TaxID=1927788 RepID=UPI0020077FA9|nr:uncharacterized protein GGS22DRAFT_149538 [Annulohypoxylon maeteangense]KAI0889928.1 hypothetical protein GGS22DRAFT_149538 [Annulohypoxylon maeteangense]